VVGCERAVVRSVIVREGGRSSIPEKVMMESKSRGVLDHPLSRVMTATDSIRMASMPLLHLARLRGEVGDGAKQSLPVGGLSASPSLPRVPLTRSQDARDLSPHAGRGEKRSPRKPWIASRSLSSGAP
jgi:hypothetical protein